MEIVKLSSTKPGLTENEQQIVRASKSNPLSSFETNEIAENLVGVVGESLIATGQKNQNSKDVAVICTQVANMIRKQLPNMKMAEVANAVEFGSFGLYAKENEVVFVSPKNILNWCIQYQTEKHKAIKKQLDFELEQKRIQDEQERHVKQTKEFTGRLVDMIMNEFNLCITSQKPSSLSWLIYDILKQTKLLHFSKERKLAIYNKAKEDVKNEFKSIWKRATQREIESDAIDRSKTIVLCEWFIQHEKEEIEQIAIKCRERYEEMHNV